MSRGESNVHTCTYQHRTIMIRLKRPNLQSALHAIRTETTSRWSIRETRMPGDCLPRSTYHSKESATRLASPSAEAPRVSIFSSLEMEMGYGPRNEQGQFRRHGRCVRYLMQVYRAQRLLMLRHSLLDDGSGLDAASDRRPGSLNCFVTRRQQESPQRDGRQ